jgi:hypothetical protein
MCPLSDLQLQPTIVDPNGTQLQVFELLWKPIGPSHRRIEQLLTKQLLKFAFEECPEYDASGPLLHFTGKFDIKLTLSHQLNRPVGLDEPVSRLDRCGIGQGLVLAFESRCAHSKLDQVVIEDRLDWPETIERNGPWSIFLLARNSLGHLAELRHIAVDLLASEYSSGQDRIEQIANHRLVDL